MNGPSASVTPAILLAALLAIGASVAWRWRQRVVRVAQPPELASDPWEDVKADYPIPDASPAVAGTAQIVEAVLKANPFSPHRRPLAANDGAGAGAGGSTSHAPPRPQFAFKGQINLGQRKRAIMEDAAAQKTYFLEVGQEVAGFKVLDIGENRVVLSDPQTREEVVVALTSEDTKRKTGAGP
jgi:hypothetical protein